MKETSSAGKINSEILLQASSVPMDIRISLLSDSDFTKVTKLFGNFLILNEANIFLKILINLKSAESIMFLVQVITHKNKLGTAIVFLKKISIEQLFLV